MEKIAVFAPIAHDRRRAKRPDGETGVVTEAAD
jgi:hypothetical protein